MRFAVKQIAGQLAKNKIFVFLLLTLIGLTSLSFFFVRFSIDGNMAALNNLGSLSENQQLYKNALNSNSSLAYLFFLSSAGLTVFVILMFFYRFFRSNRKMIGCLKSLGFQNYSLQWIFTLFIAALSILGALAGMVGGYYLSTVLIEANMQTYSVGGLVKGVSPLTVFVGLGLSTLVFSAAAFFTYFFISGTETGTLLAGNNQAAYSGVPHMADKIANLFPVKNKLALRISLRKPVAILLILIAVMSFSVFVILGRSLNISSQKVFDSQTIGHNYECDVHYKTARFNAADVQNIVPYMEAAGTVAFGSHRGQVTGISVGCILLFLALYINFQDNTRDILILYMTGYRIRQIRKMLIDIYLPMIWCIFGITLLPAIFITQAIQRSLSITTKDYMPFGTSLPVILFSFVTLTIIYWLVQAIFSFGIRRVIQKEDIAQCVASE